jgi:1,4-dihydroxy-2-naphthoyl-CoA hydrolase
VSRGPETFESFDPGVAEEMKGQSLGTTGLPAYLGMNVVEVGPGTLTASVEVGKELLNPFGSAHGGVLAALIDHVLGAVLLPLVPRGAWPATTEFKMNFLAPVLPGTLTATSTVLSLTKRTGIVRIEAFNGGRLVGLALGTVTVGTPRTPPES